MANDQHRKDLRVSSVMRRPRHTLLNRWTNRLVASIAVVLIALTLMACWAPAYVGATSREARLAQRAAERNALRKPRIKVNTPWRLRH